MFQLSNAVYGTLEEAQSLLALKSVERMKAWLLVVLSKGVVGVSKFPKSFK